MPYERRSNLILLRDKRELIIRLDKVYYFTRGNKAGLRKIGPETAEISRNKAPSKLRGSSQINTSQWNSGKICICVHCNYAMQYFYVTNSLR